MCKVQKAAGRKTGYTVSYYLTLHQDSVPIVKDVWPVDAINGKWIVSPPKGWVKAVLRDTVRQEIKATRYSENLQCMERFLPQLDLEMNSVFYAVARVEQLDYTGYRVVVRFVLPEISGYHPDPITVTVYHQIPEVNQAIGMLYMIEDLATAELLDVLRNRMEYRQIEDLNLMKDRRDFVDGLGRQFVVK